MMPMMPADLFCALDGGLRWRCAAGIGSNRAMTTSSASAPDTDARLNELEIKASYTEDLLDQLNMTIYRQQQLIDQLLAQVQQLRQQVPQDGPGGAAMNLRDELPPHY